MAQRVVRRVGEHARRGRGDPLDVGLDDVRQHRQDLGLPPGPAAVDAPDRRRDPRPRGRRGQLRRHHLRQGRVGAQAARGLGRAATSSSPGSGATSAPSPGATPPWPTCSASSRRPPAATCKAWSAEWLETAGVNTLRPEFATDDEGRFTSFAVRADRARGLADAALAPAGRSASTTAPTPGWCAATGSSSTSPARGPRCPTWSACARPDLVLVNDDDLTYAKIRLDERSLATLTESIGDFADTLPRSLCWSAAWDMTRDGEMSAQRLPRPWCCAASAARPTAR